MSLIHKQVTVLKKNQVNVSGSVRLETGVGNAPVSTASGARADGHGIAQQVRIIESNNEYAIIEVTCSCGTKAHIQCNYADVAAAGAAAAAQLQPSPAAQPQPAAPEAKPKAQPNPEQENQE